MKVNNLFRKLEKIYRALPVRFHYPKVAWDDIFHLPQKDQLVNQFVNNASKVDIEVEIIKDINNLKERIENIFIEYQRVWIDNTLKHSPLFKEKPTVANQWYAQVGITACQALIARTGSIIVDSVQSRQSGLIAPNHIVIAHQKQIYPDLYYFFEKINNDSTFPSSISIISGPSRTADIEKKLVKGAHGPSQIKVMLIS